MVEKLRGCMTIFGEYANAPVSSPETKIIFGVREDAEQLSDNTGDIFYSVVGEILFIMKRSRLDLETVVVFLTTRLSKSDVTDWENCKG